MRLNRRTFMGLGLAGIGALALPRRATAAGSKNLVVVFARGAFAPDSPAGQRLLAHVRRVGVCQG